ncbi:putative uridine kinase [Phaeomoniella chlamydospora]|uniref:Uridine kinase n=1 Tax=Phaeomoniella chlamydospora TaxID=158046 RepID=A0A0G2GF16_PHACM|nr:putative uridine kinase [Phaeomoniella chlamydospora]
MEAMEPIVPLMSYKTTTQKAHYSPPWADMSIIGIAGSSGSGKTSLAIEILKSLSLPWVIILSIDSFYKPLTPEQHALAHQDTYDFDSPESIDFDLLVEKLLELKKGQLTEIPVYSFAEHQRMSETVSIYAPHIVILEGILALNDPRVLDTLDMKIFVEADADVCLSRRIVRDVRERGRTIEGVIKQWFAYVKPVFWRYVEPQRHTADVIIPRGMENKIAISMVCNQIRLMLKEKSIAHNAELARLGQQVKDEPFSSKLIVMENTPQVQSIATILRSPNAGQVDFVFYFDRLTSLLIEKALDHVQVDPVKVTTPQKTTYNGLKPVGKVSAVVILRGGSCLETGLKRTIPDCMTGRMLIQSNFRTGEPELHYFKLFPDIKDHSTVLLLDPQMSSGGAALMAVRTLVDHGVDEEKIVFVTCLAGNMGVKRLMSVFPGITVIAANIADDNEERWIEKKYFGC